MQIIRQATSQAIQLGPFVDSTDGSTPETGLTIANTDIRISKDGAASVAKNAGGATVDGSNGFYTTTLDTTDTSTVGLLDINIAMTGALPVFIRFQVIETATYDSIYADGATALALDSKIDTIDGIVDDILLDTAEIANLNDFDPATDDVAVVTLVTTTTTNTDMRGTNSAATATDLATAQTDLDTITGGDGAVIASAQTVATVTDVTNEVSADITAISGSSTAADNLEASALGIISDVATGTPTTTTCTLTNAPAVTGVLVDRVIVVTSGARAGEAKTITGYTSGRVATFDAMVGAISSSDTVVIV